MDILTIITNALDLIHKEILMRNAYDVGLISKDHYQNYLKTIFKEFTETPTGILKQEPKTGHWIDTGSGQMCSICGEIQYGYDSFRQFCASCGAKMVEP